MNDNRGGTNPSTIHASLVDCVTTNSTVVIHKARLRGFFDSSPIDCSTLAATDVPVSLRVSFRGRVNGAVDDIDFAGRAKFARSRFTSTGEQLVTDSTGQETLDIPDAGDPVEAAGSFAPGVAVATLDVQYPPSLLQGRCSAGSIWSLPLTGAIYLGSPANPPLGIDSLQDLGSDATAINDNNEVAGFSVVNMADGSVTHHAIVWTPKGGTVDLDSLSGGSDSVANDVNNNGEVVGSFALPGQSSYAFTWTQAAGMDYFGANYPELPSDALAVNDNGQVVGDVTEEDGNAHAFSWTPSTGMLDLGTLPGGTSSYAQGVNDNGEVVGVSGTATSTRAFAWTQSGGMVELPALPGDTGAAAVGVSNTGLVAGYSVGPDGSQAVVWSPSGAVQPIGSLPGASGSYAASVNEWGEVVGDAYGPQGTQGFTWTQSGGIVALSVAPGANGAYADTVNDWGGVAGYSYGSNGVGRAALWLTPW